ncbi:calcium/sodium antiporter [Haloferax namakaokahaiae]|uniref:Calcium/sodium antiporter n=1 Tax=Haloferax namakaokahaiae TaxID=1748331 RepID=A0ABD5ZDK0_9EURY
MVSAVLLATATFLVSIVVLWVGSELFVTNAAKVARRVGLSDLTVGLTVVALGTSAPEVAVSIDAALVGAGDIAIANVVGSNLFNVGLILGGIAVVAGVRSSPLLIWRDGVVMVGSSLVVLLFVWDLRVTRVEGAILLGLFVAYLLVLFVASRGEQSHSPSNTEMTWWTPVLLVVGFVAIVGAAQFLVESAVSIARTVGLSEWVIGETIVAVGTSTPEIVASAAAARKGMGDVAAGNLIGSNIFNALFILGITTTIAPVSVAETATGTTLWLVAISALAAVLLGTERVLGRLEGLTLVMINLSRWVLDVL